MRLKTRLMDYPAFESLGLWLTGAEDEGVKAGFVDEPNTTSLT